MLGRIVLSATIASGISFAADAACSPRDLVGRWSMSVVAFSSNDAFVGYCNFAIAADGDITGSCTAHDLEDSFEGSISGNWRVSVACQVRGTFATQPDVASDVQARMNQGKDVITGISLDPGTINQFTAVKAQGHRRARGKRENRLRSGRRVAPSDASLIHLEPRAARKAREGESRAGAGPDLGVLRSKPHSLRQRRKLVGRSKK
jgi:hypothetical protein